jgi:AMIN domain
MNRRIGIFAVVSCFVTAVCVATVSASPVTASRTTAQLRSVRLRPADGSIQVVFGLSGGVHYKSTRTPEPSRITIDLPQTGISPVFTKRELLSVHPALIRVQITRSTAATRAVLDLAAAGPHTVYAVSDELIVEIKTRAPAPNTRTAAAPLPSSAVPAFGVGLPGRAPQMPDVVAESLKTTLKIP